MQLNTAITFTSSCPTNYTTHWYNGNSCLNCNVAGSWSTRQYDFTGTGQVEVKAKCVDSNQCEGDPSNVIRVNVIDNPCINKSLPAPQVQNVSVRSGESFMLSPSCSSGTAQVFLSNQWTNAPYTLTNINVPVTYQARCAETVGSATCSGAVVSGSVTLRANQGLIVNPTPDQDLTVNTPVDFYVNAFTDPDG
ncbi:hypothetical protein, partial [Arsenicibacter rosenii]|uniref:hypothetical protein n=1 Tax=Arsenicibacter rosenii TaxID=1750698 RepID=UPI00116043EE